MANSMLQKIFKHFLWSSNGHFPLNDNIYSIKYGIIIIITLHVYIYDTHICLSTYMPMGTLVHTLVHEHVYGVHVKTENEAGSGLSLYLSHYLLSEYLAEHGVLLILYSLIRLLYGFWGLKLQSSCLDSNHFIHWAISPGWINLIEEVNGQHSHLKTQNIYSVTRDVLKIMDDAGRTM